jgi:peptidoglycan/LPS O-acetylase OafA/YrhL
MSLIDYPKRTKTHDLASLDIARAGAAVLVVAGHVRNLFFVDYGSVVHPIPMLSLVYLGTSLGRQAVMVFFVLSGFLIATGIHTASATGRWSVRTYAVRRLTRLLVVLIPALLLTFVLDRSAIAWLPGGYLYVHPPSSEAVLTFSAAANDAPLTLLGNMAFLQGILVPSFGSDSPLWSLAYEFWYYVAFPLLFFAVIGPGGGFRRATHAIFGVGILVFVGTTISLYFIIWMFGAAVALAYDRWGSVVRVPDWVAPLAVVGLVAAFAAGRFLPVPFLRDLAIGLAFTAVLIGLRFRPTKRRRPRYAAAAAWWAGAAYTIYLVHFPVLLFLRALLIPAGRLQPSIRSAEFAVVVFVGVLVFAIAFAQLTERRTDMVRASVEKGLRLLGRVQVKG